MKKCAQWLGLGLVVVVAIVLALNRQWFSDFMRGVGYQPVGEMERIMQDLDLTGRGEFLFRAARPELSLRDGFNATCRSMGDEEMAVLGCYTDGTIYVYNIDAAELDGIRELTTAHELLHVVWERMSDSEKQNLDAALTSTLNNNWDVLGEELEAYEANERQEELFVRAGTEVADLPTELEKVYGEVFNEQDKIVSFYDRYIGVFKAMETEMEELSRQMETIENQVGNINVEYEGRMNTLNNEIDAFNACAETAGCFESESEFYARRAALVNEQDALGVLYEQLDSLVNQYNDLVERYNADVIRTDELNQMMNSYSAPDRL